MKILVLAALVALATPAFGSDLDRKVKDLEQTVRQLRKEVTYMQKADMKLMDAHEGWRKEMRRIVRAHDKVLKELDQAGVGTLELITLVKKNALASCAAMIERHGEIVGFQQPRDLKDRLLRGFR